jgi:hypothetical protein
VVASASHNLGMQASRLHTRYKLSAPISAVRLEEQPGSTLRKPTSTLIEIPQDVVVEMEGAVPPSGLVSILWAGQVFSVYYEDLQQKAQVLEKSWH